MKYLKSKLLFYISLILVFTVVFLTLISSIFYYNSSKAQAEQYSSYLAAAYQEGINSVINNYRSDMERIAQNSSLVDGKISKGEQKSLLEQEVEAIGFNFLAVADKQGKNDRNDNIVNQDFFEQAKNGTTYLASPALNREKNLTFLIAAPIRDTGNVLYGEIPYDLLSKELDQIKIGESGYAFVININGKTVIHPDKTNVENPVDYFELSKKDSSYQMIADIFQQMVAGKTGTGYSNYKGIRRLVAYTPLSGPEGWSVAVTTPVTQLDENLFNTLKVSMGVGLLLLIIAIFVTRIFSERITQPIVKATKRMELLAQGDLHEADEEVRGKDEVARLTLALQNTVHNLRSYIMDISHVLDAISKKDLTVKSSVNYTGDFVSIHNALDLIVKSLNATLNGINQSTDQVRIGSKQVALGGQNLAESSAEQASTTEHLMNSLDLISTRIEKNAEYSLSVQSTAQTALMETQQGDQEMKKMLQSMESIDSSSKKIQNIIKMINDIAFQTNILALNAAIEASRAGEAGKGFAVVADEVRELASKSAEAANNTTTLIETTIQSVRLGMQNADKTAGSFEKIVEQTNSITDLISKMSESLNNQSKSIKELDEGMRQISIATQSNSATAEESAATSEELLSQTSVLKEMVAEFKIAEKTK